MRAGVCCHRGRSFTSAYRSESLAGVEVEKLHAEVSEKARREGWAARRDDDAPDTSVRRGRFDAIVGRRWGYSQWREREGVAGAGRGLPVGGRR
jgi:hypothetical protein